MTMNIIHDGDHGSDDFVTTLMLFARPDLFNVLAITTCHGNVSVTQAGINATRACALAKREDVPVYIGADKPWKIEPKLGDNAFSGDGLGGVEIPNTDNKPNITHAVDYMKTALDNASGKITFIVTGPMTNMALLLSTITDEQKSKIDRIIAMGGGFAPDGNITDYAEFNFYMDPEAADFVLNSGLDIVLHNLHSDHQMVVTPKRQQQFIDALPIEWGEKFSKLMRSAEHLDMAKFGSEGSFVHDEQTVVYLQNPEFYEVFYATARVNTDPSSPKHGQLTFEETNSRQPLQIVRNILDIDAAFNTILSNIKTTLQA